MALCSKKYTNWDNLSWLSLYIFLSFWGNKKRQKTNIPHLSDLKHELDCQKMNHTYCWQFFRPYRLQNKSRFFSRNFITILSILYHFATYSPQILFWKIHNRVFCTFGLKPGSDVGFVCSWKGKVRIGCNSTKQTKWCSLW